MNGISPELLKKLHWDEMKTFQQIAVIVGCSVGSVHNLFKRNKITARKSGHIAGNYHVGIETKNKISKAHKGKTLSAMTRAKISEGHKLKTETGHKKIRTDGYVHLYAPNYAGADSTGYVLEHRFVMEQALGRCLSNAEVVHHINGVRDDNRLENLKLFPHESEHQIFHSNNTRNRINGRFAS